MGLFDREIKQRRAPVTPPPTLTGLGLGRSSIASPTPPSPSNEQRLRQIIESAPVSLIVITSTGQIVAANRATLALFATEDVNRVRGHDLTSFVGDEDRPQVAEFVAHVCAGQARSLRYQLLNALGERRTVETRGVPLSRGDGSAFVLGVTWEIADQAAHPEQEPEARSATVEAADAPLREASPDPAVVEELRSEIRTLLAVRAEEAEQYRQIRSERIAERERLDARIAELEAEVHSHAAERTRLEAEVAAVESAATLRVADREQLDAQVAELIAAASRHIGEREQLERRIADLEGEGQEHSA